MPEGIIGWLRRRPLPARVAIFAVIAVLTFVLAAASGAAVAMVLDDDSTSARWQEPRDGRGLENDPVSEVTDISTANNTAPDEDGPEGDAASSVASPRWEALQRCERTQAECASDFVAGIAPRAEYAGGRIEPDDSGRTRTVLYFVDPGKQRCEYRRFESAADRGAGSYYVVLIAGAGSFAQQQYGDSSGGCVPDV